MIAMWKNRIRFKFDAFLLLLLAAAGPLPGAEVLFDFESPDALEAWKCNTPDGELQRSTALAAAGDAALCFTTPAWRPGEHDQQSSWPSFEARVSRPDWSKYDRLVIEVFNDSAATMPFNVFLCDSQRPLRQGARYLDAIGAYAAKQLVLPLPAALADKGIDGRDIAVLHCYSENPPADLTFYLDAITLLEPGEPLPETSAAYRRKTKELLQQRFARQSAAIRAELTALDEEQLPPAVRNYWLEQRDAYLAELELDGDCGEALIAELLSGVRRRALVRQYRTLMDFEAYRTESGSTAPDVVLGRASSMEKVLPQAANFQPVTGPLRLAAARNEREASQLIVLPTGSDLAGVTVTVSALSDGRHDWPDGITVIPVGYVETKQTPPSGSPYLGFWPDVLLPFLDTVPVRRGTAQAFWLRLAVPENQPAGEYRGEARVIINGKTAFQVPLIVTVYDFTLPKALPLATAITFFGKDIPTPATADILARWRQNPDYPGNAWKRHRPEWAAMLADYGITYDSLYEYAGWEPDFAILAELKKQGRLGKFNLGYFGPASDDPADDYGMQSTLERLRSRYQRARELGLLDHAYLYGCDEVKPELFERVERAAAILKREFPDVPLFTTAYDENYGLDGRLASFDWFCPLMPKYDPDKAEKARQAGKQVWFYICLAPVTPYANFFVESPAIDGRLLLGAMSAKYRPDGFLYYQVSLWNNEKPITAGPFTDWDPRSFHDYHGDGSWTCPGPDGTPLATIRLENFRDGLEDYAYDHLLRERLAAVKAAGIEAAEWIEAAETVLAVPDEVVASLTRYTDDPETVYRYRHTLATLIEQTPQLPTPGNQSK